MFRLILLHCLLILCIVDYSYQKKCNFKTGVKLIDNDLGFILLSKNF